MPRLDWGRGVKITRQQQELGTRPGVIVDGGGGKREAATRASRPRRPCTRNKEIEYLLHVVGRVGGVGVDVVRHGADLPLLHDLRIAHANKVSNDLVSLF